MILKDELGGFLPTPIPLVDTLVPKEQEDERGSSVFVLLDNQVYNQELLELVGMEIRDTLTTSKLNTIIAGSALLALSALILKHSTRS